MRLPIVIFMISAAVLSFGYGIIVGVYEVFPYKTLKTVLNSVELVMENKNNLMGDRPVGFLSKRRYDGNKVTIFKQDKTSQGFTLISGFFDDLPELRLIRLDGSVVRKWPISYKKYFPDTSHILPVKDVPATDWNAAIHGTHITPDGAVVFNMDGKGTFKLDRCGNVDWLLPRMTHHSINVSSDGSYWIPSRHYIVDQAKHPLFQTPYRDDTILHISVDGKVLSEISVFEILIKNGLYSLLVANGKFKVNMKAKDGLHMNDIEELKSEYASNFPYFSTGDLLLSLRHLNLLVVLDPTTWIVKWYRIGPWLRQHDPDFEKNGTISVFNNNSDDTKKGELFGGSQIMSFTPHSTEQQVKILFGKEQDKDFFTNTQGKHQTLENGNILVAEYKGGRVFEFDPKGEIVWQYINQFDEEYVARISGATRYAENYFNVDDWSCPIK